MISLFPGMDPYLERHWLDVHARLVTYCADDLNTHLPPELIARIEERTAIESEPAEHRDFASRRNIAPDARVFESVAEDQGASAAGGGIALAPFRLLLLDEPLIEHFIEIIDVRGGEKLVTVIEFVSPTNKHGKGLDAFVQKREELCAGGVNFVEIDLVRSGDWERLLLPHRCPASAKSVYRAVIRVPNDARAAYFQPIGLRDPLPPLKIPLRTLDVPIDLPLQQLIETVYRNGRYGRTLNYLKPCDPPLEPEDQSWLDEIVKGRAPR